jgi:hypothetical protein
VESVLLYHKWMVSIIVVLCLVYSCVCIGEGEQVGFYSSCVLKYDFIVSMVHSIISHGVCFNYVVHESMLSIAYGVIYIYMCVCV